MPLQKKAAAKRAAKKAAKGKGGGAGEAGASNTFGKGVVEIRCRFAEASDLEAATNPASASGVELHTFLKDLLERLTSGGVARLPRLPLVRLRSPPSSAPTAASACPPPHSPRPLTLRVP